MLKLIVKLIAEEKRLNRNQLQLMSGVTLPLLTRYWNNNTTEVRLDALERIARALNVMPGELIATEAQVLNKYGMKGWQSLNKHDGEETQKISAVKKKDAA